MICECGHHMGAHRPFCRDCEFNTAGCRKFAFDVEATMKAIAPIPMPPPGGLLVYRDGRWQEDHEYIDRIMAPAADVTFLIDTSDWVKVDPESPRDRIRFEYPGQCGVITNIEGASGDPTSDS